MIKNRGFEKVSLTEFQKYYPAHSYNDIMLPVRKTANSAGYDFHLIEDVIINPNEERIIKTGIKAYMLKDEFLMVVIRSSLGFKHNLRIKNQLGIIDSDYYNNPDNEGHILIAIKNEGYVPVKLQKGEAFVQGIFQKFLTSDDDDNPKDTRVGGIGSTN